MKSRLYDKEHQVKEKWLSRLALIREKMLANGDRTRTEKMLQLIEKLRNNEFSIGFCGHFSAGKSSIINQLWEVDLLPSSPIPTSANLVKVKSGKPYARVYFKEKDPVQFAYPYDLKKVKSFCVDGDEVKSVEISHPSDAFPEDVVIMDTPGIDSTDDAHRVATTSSLHLADVVFYVMDYNHVLSELNFHFTKELKEQGKRMYVIVNQIDKHNPDELHFHTFQSSVRHAFHHWDIEPDGIFYTSLAEKNHPFNQFDQLQHFIQSLIVDREQLRDEYIWNAVVTLINEHQHWYRSRYEAKMEDIHHRFGDLSEDERKRIYEEYHDIIDRVENDVKSINRFEQMMQTELANISNNAILMPYETRELAKAYLESCQERFKVGFLFSRKKTEEERNRRLELFYNQFLENVTSQLDWHMKQTLVDSSKKFGLEDNELFLSIYHENISIPMSVLSDHVKQGATVNADYVLHYTEDVAEAAKRIYRTFAQEKGRQLLERFKEKITSKNKRLNDQLIHLEEKIKAMTLLEKIENDVKLLKEEAISLLNGSATKEEEKEAISRLPEGKEVPILEVSDEVFEIASKETSHHSQDDPWPNASFSDVDQQAIKSRLNHTAKRLKQTAKAVSGIKGFQTLAKEMDERAERLKNKRYIVALFGAFSAGKSSFANALIGDYLLPVSPNPTTATINKILPAEVGKPHGTVIVKMKSEEQLLSDVQASLNLFDFQIDSLERVQDIIGRLQPENLPPKARPHYTFLKAVEKGFQAYQQHAGEEVEIDLTVFKDYVVDEDKACFVEWIELYYDCPLTEHGITLVDTPGADSINARHTGVAFEYIKNADAILFVTYYNHAFSNADREFLIQLGRVKDVFELDKMFFVLNAADLAKSEEELSLVLHHVKENLLQYGIRQPRLYPVSSKTALLAKLDEKRRLNDDQQKQFEQLLKDLLDQKERKRSEIGLERSGIPAFEQSFLSFTVHELTDMAIEAAKSEMKRAVHTLDEWINVAKQGKEVREEKRKQCEETRSAVLDMIQRMETLTDENALLQEIEELFYYIKQRIFLRYKDAFKEFFNPAVLQQDRQTIKDKLNDCLDELLEFIGFDLVQEIRATTLRIESFLKKRVKEKWENALKAIHEQSLDVLIHEWEYNNIKSPDFHETFDTVDKSRLLPVLSMFKNAKHFFEQNGKNEMQESLEQALHLPVERFLTLNRDQLIPYYIGVYHHEVQELQKRLSEQVNEYVDGTVAALSFDIDIHQLIHIYEQIKQWAEL